MGALRIGIAAAVALAAVAAPASGEERVEGVVVQVTATEVYVSVGARVGVRAGDVVDIDVGRAALVQLRVVEVGPKSARAALPGDAPIPAVGARVSAAKGPPPKKRRRGRVIKLKAPRTAAAMAARWDGLDTTRPSRIAYAGAGGMGPGAREPGADVSGTVAIDYLGVVDVGGDGGLAPYHRVGLRSDLDVVGAMGGWLGYSHRLRLRLDIASDLDDREFAAARNTLYVYRMRASLDSHGIHAEIGRTHAAPLPGASLIDGATARHRVSEHVYVGAFGGLAPVITDLGLTADATRFGAYASLRYGARRAGGWRLAADGGVIGTTFEGAVDRRALAARATLSDRDRWVHGQAVVDFFAADHPADRPAADPSVLVLDAGARLTPWLRASARFDHFRAARTREALAALPPEYASALAFSSVRGSVDLSLPRGLRLGAFAGWRRPTDGASALWTGADVRAGSLLLGNDVLSVGVDGAFGTFQDAGAATLRYTLPVHARADVTARYRLVLYRYGDENQRLFSHAPSLGVDAAIGWGVRAGLDVDAYIGDEERVVTGLATAAFRF